ncbi:3-phosphoshikimate 1-carboxyvinyltransferase [compost metagenome]
MLIAPKLENGLELTLEGKITSIPYIKMTLALLNEIGVETTFIDNTITVKKLITHNSKLITVESDWSSASYFYSIVALSEIGTEIKLFSYKENSLQGDSVLSKIYKNLGVETLFENNQIILRRSSDLNLQSQILDLNEAPDIAQTIAVTCFGLGIGCHLTGLHTLKIKETDRLEALRIELEKLGANITVTNDSLTLEVSSVTEQNVAISTYNDHRMAMAFAPLALITDIIINDAEVVSKSFPDFWDNLKQLGFNVEKL